MTTVYACIGNSDDKLTQARWHEFWIQFRATVITNAQRIYGEWTSIAVSPYQNACICFETLEGGDEVMKHAFARLAREYSQDSIAWAEAPVTEFLGEEWLHD
jgi:hypothetical protein